MLADDRNDDTIPFQIRKTITAMAKSMSRHRTSWHYDPLCSWEDLYQEGCIGYFAARAKYDPQKSAAYTAYILKGVKTAILDALRKIYHLTSKNKKLIKDIERLRDEFQKLNGRRPTMEEFFKLLPATKEAIMLILERGRPVIRLDHLSDDKDQKPWNHFPSPCQTPEEITVEKLHREETKKRVAATLRSMNATQRRVLVAKFFEEKETREIADELGYSHTWVRWACTKALGAFSLKYARQTRRRKSPPTW